MSKSRWHQMSDEQKQQHRDGERKRRALRKEQMTDDARATLRDNRKLARERRKTRDIDHHRTVEREYKRNGMGYFYSWANAIKTRAQRKGIPFDIDADYLLDIMTTHCPVFGVKFERRASRHDNSPYAPTLDRIVPSVGYVRGNVIVVSKRANQIKSDASVAEIEQVAHFYKSLQE